MANQAIEHERGSERSFRIVFAAVFAIVGVYQSWGSTEVLWWPFASDIWRKTWL
jgi:hypothetical protein